MAPLRPNSIAVRSIFFAVMGGAAIVSLLRGFALAAILPIAEFGVYATLIALGSFCSSLAGVGKVEEARKTFPRRAIDGHGALIAVDADAIARLMLIRIGFIACLATSILLIWEMFDWLLAIISVGAVVFGTAWCALLASALRANESPLPLAFNSSFRAASALVLVIVGGQLFSLQGALIGEGVAAVIGGIAMRATLGRMKWPSADGMSDIAVDNSNSASKVSWSGMYVFFGTFASSAPFYLSRSVVGISYSPENLATFGFLMLFVAAAVAGLGIADQIFGTEFVKMQRSGVSFQVQTRRMYFLIGVFAVGIIVSLALFFVIQPYTPINVLFQKYKIENEHAIPIIIFASLHITSTIDWYLLANDKEKYLFQSSIFYASIFFVSAAISFATTMPFKNFLWLVAITKIGHLIFSVALVLRFSHNNSSSHV